MGLFRKNGPKTYNKKSVYYQIVNITEDYSTISDTDYVNCVIIIDSYCLNIKFDNCGFFNCVTHKKGATFIEYKRCDLKDQIITQGFYGWCNICGCTIGGSQINYSLITQSSINDGIIFGSSVIFSTSRIRLSATNKVTSVRYFDIGLEDKREGIVDNKICFRGYKKALSTEDKEVIVELLIPEENFISGGYLKHRTNKAYVNRIYSVNKKSKYKYAHSKYSYAFKYTVGEWVETDTDMNSVRCCTKGIHFFFREEDAIDYYM